MSGIVGSKINIRGSGLIDKLGTDGQVFTSAGLGLPPTFADEINEKGQKKVNNFRSYLNILKSQNIILDQEERKTIIVRKFNNICNSRKLKNNFNEKLIEEVVNLVEKPNVIVGRFSEIYLKVPQEILIVTMQQHQKYFPLFDNNNKLTNLFLLVANLPDKKGYIKTGNQRVIEARLSDAKFFWDKNKAQNLVKQVGKLKNLSFSSHSLYVEISQFKLIFVKNTFFYW